MNKPISNKRRWIRNAAITFGAAAGTQLVISVSMASAISGAKDNAAVMQYLSDHPWPSMAAGMIAQAIVGMVVYMRLVRKHEHRSVSELGSRNATGEFTVGLIIGFCFISLVMATLWALGAYHPTGVQLGYGFLMGLALGIGAAFVEEPIFRGFIQRHLHQWMGPVTALTITSALFGVVHLANSLATGESPSIIGLIAIMIEAGILLGAAYYATRRLWLAIGIHLAWNTTLYGVYGATTSGIASPGGLVQGSFTGSTLLTGGTFGPEASIVTIAWGVVFGLGLLLIAKRRHGALTLDPPTTS